MCVLNNLGLSKDWKVRVQHNELGCISFRYFFGENTINIFDTVYFIRERWFLLVRCIKMRTVRSGQVKTHPC